MSRPMTLAELDKIAASHLAPPGPIDWQAMAAALRACHRCAGDGKIRCADPECYTCAIDDYCADAEVCACKVERT